MDEDREIHALARAVGAALEARGEWLVTAESCTGGWVSAAVTAVAGSSNWFERGLVTYSDRAKRDLLAVREATLAKHGAVSEAVVAEMAFGALEASPGTVAIAVSGIAGPAGAMPGKPVGTVCFAWRTRSGQATTRMLHFPGGRDAVRRQAVATALQGVLDLLAERAEHAPPPSDVQ
jgi:nicotinamide-nucleotide amidase